jgi:O-antigen/teichoic acid export membrane protein
MQKKFLKNLAFLIVLNLLVKPFWILGVDREVQNAVGPEEYGFYFTILNFSYLFYILLDLGITNFNNRNIAQNNQLLSKHMAGISTLKILLGVFYGVLIFVIGWIIGYNDRQLYLLAWVGFNQFLLSFILYLRSNISGLLLFKTEGILSVLDRLLMIFICGSLVWISSLRQYFTIEWFVYAQTISYTVTAMIALIAVLYRSGKLRLNWNPAFFLLILKKSAPFALLALIMSFYSRIDPVLIERVLGGTFGSIQVGIFAQGYRLLDAGQNFALLFAVLLLPLFAKMIKENESFVKLLKLSFSIIISGTLIVAITSLFYGEQIMQLMYTQTEGELLADYAARISESAKIFKLLMFSLVFVSSIYIFGTLLTANNSLKHLNLIALVSLSLNILLNLLLIPKYYAVGSAYANLAAQGISALLQIFISYKIFRFSINYSLIIRLIATVILLLLLGYVLQYMNLESWFLSMCLMLILGLSVSFGLKLMNIKEFVSILRE